MLVLSGMKFEPKGSTVHVGEPSEEDRKQRDVLTLRAGRSTVLGGRMHIRIQTHVPPVVLRASLSLVSPSVLMGEFSLIKRACCLCRASISTACLRNYSESGLLGAYYIQDILDELDSSRGSSSFHWLLAISFDWLRDKEHVLNDRKYSESGLLGAYYIQDILDELDSSRSSSTFHWLLAISFDWSIISPFLRRITSSQVRIDDSPSSLSSSGKELSSLWHSIFSATTYLTHRLLSPFFPNGGKSRSLSSSDAVPRTASGTTTEEVEAVVIQAQAQGKLRLRLLEACTQLAAQLGLPLEKLGTLHDVALETGSRIGIEEFLWLSEQEASRVRDGRDAEEASKARAEGGRSLMLLLVRVLPQHQQQQQQQSSSEAVLCSDSQGRVGFKGTPQENGGGRDNGATGPRSFYQQEQTSRIALADGFKMRFMGRFRDVLAETTGAKPDAVDKALNGCKNNAAGKYGSVLEAGCTYVSLFVEQVSCDGSSEVLVYDFAKHQLPSYRLHLPALTKEMRDWLYNMSGFTASDIIQICKDEVEQGRLLSARFSRDHTFACDWEEQRQAQQGQQQRQVEAELIDFKEALAKALSQLMCDMSFVGEGLETWTYLTRHILDVPSVQVDDGSPNSSSDGEMVPSSPPRTHMIVFHAEIPDPLDTDLLEGESDLTHLSTSSTSASRNMHGLQMPSVFEFIPRTLFDVVRALAVSQPAREAFRVEATKELDWLISDDRSHTTSHSRDRGRPAAVAASSNDLRTAVAASSKDLRTGGHAPGRLSRALVSSFSIDSLSDEESGTYHGAGAGAIRARVKKSWAAFKTRARALSLSRRKAGHYDRRHQNIETGSQIPLSSSFSQSASRTHLLSHSHTGSSSTTMTTATATTATNTSTKMRPSEWTSYSIPISEPQPIVPADSRTNLNLSPYTRRHLYPHSRSAVELGHVSRIAAISTTNFATTTTTATRNTVLKAGAPLPSRYPYLDNGHSALRSCTRPELEKPEPTSKSRSENSVRGRSRSHSRSRGRTCRSRWLDIPESVPVPVPIPLPLPVAAPIPLHELSAGQLPRRSMIPGSGSGAGSHRSVTTTAFMSAPDVANTKGFF
ncbi:hypothetical protein A7U60_g8056 [Sanghuangporus baumii]|uniref:Uncharacterized protein n=1 Tax=Sanghuangporus baumii TaxID=108892 RepID=A0A9Q5HRU2_SANBA|nr:hypothetical protein A7U60_g8056 [Sanghuangporus baumii]